MFFPPEKKNSKEIAPSVFEAAMDIYISLDIGIPLTISRRLPTRQTGQIEFWKYIVLKTVKEENKRGKGCSETK